MPDPAPTAAPQSRQARFPGLPALFVAVRRITTACAEFADRGVLHRMRRERKSAAQENTASIAARMQPFQAIARSAARAERFLGLLWELSAFACIVREC